jgi:hypothetical protein
MYLSDSDGFGQLLPPDRLRLTPPEQLTRPRWPGPSLQPAVPQLRIEPSLQPGGPQLRPPARPTTPPRVHPGLVPSTQQLEMPAQETIADFASEASALTNPQLARVNSIARGIANSRLGPSPITSVRVTGRIDYVERGANLGRRRALAVRDALIAALGPELTSRIRWIIEDRGRLGRQVDIYFGSGRDIPPEPPTTGRSPNIDLRVRPWMVPPWDKLDRELHRPSPRTQFNQTPQQTPAHLGQSPTPASPAPSGAPSPQAGRRPPNPLDARARAIIAAASDPATGIYGRAVATVWSILRTYYPAETGKVSWVIYSENQPGLLTTRLGAGASARGGITVGRYFLEHTTEPFFARRVLQVGHELRHIDQYRAGMIGHDRQPEREFLAHCWAIFAGERPGTGRMNHSTRVSIIDAALGNLNCLSRALRARYAKEEEMLRAIRTREQAASGRPATLPPTACIGSH